MKFILPDRTTEDMFNDLMEDLWNTWNDTPAEIYITPKQRDFMRKHWVYEIPETKTVKCDACGYSHEEVVSYKELPFEMKKGLITVYESDYGHHIFKEVK